MSFKNNNNTTVIGALFNTGAAGLSWINGASTELTNTYGIGNYEDAKQAGKRGKAFVQNNLGTLETELYRLVVALELTRAAGKDKKAARLASRILKVNKAITSLNATNKADKSAHKVARKAVKASKKL